MEITVETENLTKMYGRSMVANSINLHIPKGKIYGLLDRNGAGKTTLMKMLLHLVRPSSGKVKLFGKEVFGNNDIIYHKVGSIIESPGFYQNLTAFENLSLIGRLRGKKDRSWISETLDIVGLLEENKTYSQFSLGMKQRLGLAAAIMHEPELLLLDEPINGLDPIGISEMRLFLSNLSKVKGTTILISSHILKEVEEMSDIIGIMRDGCLIEEKNIDDLRKRKRKYIEYEVSDTLKAALLLETIFRITKYTIHENTINIYECMERRGEINKILNQQNILVTRINIVEEKLEEYFSSMILGDRND